MQMMFSGDWRPSVWPAVQVHSLLLGDGDGGGGGGGGAAALCGRWSGLMQVAVLACLEGKWVSIAD